MVLQAKAYSPVGMQLQLYGFLLEQIVAESLITSLMRHGHDFCNEAHTSLCNLSIQL